MGLFSYFDFLRTKWQTVRDVCWEKVWLSCIKYGVFVVNPLIFLPNHMNKYVFPPLY